MTQDPQFTKNYFLTIYSHIIDYQFCLANIQDPVLFPWFHKQLLRAEELDYKRV